MPDQNLGLSFITSEHQMSLRHAYILCFYVIKIICKNRNRLVVIECWSYHNMDHEVIKP